MKCEDTSIKDKRPGQSESKLLSIYIVIVKQNITSFSYQNLPLTLQSFERYLYIFPTVTAQARNFRTAAISRNTRFLEIHLLMLARTVILVQNSTKSFTIYPKEKVLLNHHDYFRALKIYFFPGCFKELLSVLCKRCFTFPMYLKT